jgi:glycosyltransferase involved in cell wall biosynthesis
MESSSNIHLSSTNRRVRVLFVPQWYPPKDGHNKGWGTFCREHVHAAARYDDVAVLVFTARRQHRLLLCWEQVNDCGIPTFYATFGQSPLPKTTWLLFRLYLWQALRRITQEWGRPDVIHTQDTYAYPVIKAAQSLGGFPCVISQHWTGFMRRRLDNRTLRQLRWAFARAARVFPVNQFAAVDYEHYGIQASVTWVPNALDTEVFSPLQQVTKAPWLLHVSGFTAQKRFPDIVRAFAHVRAVRPEVVLQVAGDGVHRAEMEALATRELPPGSFHFHGYLPKPDLATLMRRACGFVFPSEAETFGCVLMEAMACGCPVLTTRVGGIPAVVREGEGLFVEVGNIDQIAAGMLRLLDGTHGLDMASISRSTRERFNHATIGRMLHEGHLRAAGVAEEVR